MASDLQTAIQEFQAYRDTLLSGDDSGSGAEHSSISEAVNQFRQWRDAGGVNSSTVAMPIPADKQATTAPMVKAVSDTAAAVAAKENYITSIGLVEPDYEYSTPGEYASRIRAEKKVVAPRSIKVSIDPIGTAAQIKKEKENALVPEQLKKAPWIKEEMSLPDVSMPVEYRKMADSASAAHIDQLEHERSLLLQKQKIDEYNALTLRSDFAVNSQPVPNKRDFVNLVINYGFDESIDTFNAVGRLSERYGLTEEERNSLLVSDGQNSAPFDKGYVYLSKEERAIYNYLYNTAGREEAQGFLDALETVLSKRRAIAKSMSDQERYENANAFEKGVQQVMLPATMLAGNVGSAVSDVVTGLSGNYNPYSVGHNLTNYTQTIMGTTSQDIIDKIDAAGGSELAGQLAVTAYQAVINSASSALGVAAFGKGYLAVAGAGAASQKAKELYEKGASGRQIFAGALASGFIEIALEKLPLDELLNAKAATKTIRGVISSTLKQSGIEATGEALTELTNIVADCLIQGGNSDLAQLQQQYISEGNSETDAYRLALRDKATEVAWSGFGGFVSGGASGFTFSATGLVQHNAAIHRIGQDYINGVDGHSIDEALAIGNNNAHTTEAYKLAQSLSEKVQNGQDVSAADVGRMLYESSTPEAAKARALDAAVRDSAQRYGVAEDIAEDMANIAAATGRTIEFATDAELGATLDGDNTVAGSYDPATGIVKINAAATAEDARNYIIKHELAHSVEGTRQWEQLADIVQAQMGDEGYSNAIAEMMERRAASGQALDMPAAELEVVAEWVGDNLYKGNFAQAIVNGDATIGNAFVRTIDKLRLALGNKKSRANTQLAVVERLFMRALEQDVELRDGDVEYYINSDFANEYDSWDKKDPRKVFEVGTTSAVLKQLGVPDQRITWDASKIIKIKNDHPEMTDAIIKRVPEVLESPVIIMRSKSISSRLTMFGELYADGKPVLVILELSPKGRNGIALEELKIASAYGKDRAQSFVDSSEVIYVSEDKTRVSNWEKRTGLQLPVGSPVANSNTNIAENANGVNTQSMQNAGEHTRTPQNAVVNRAWMQGDTTVDRHGNPVENPVRSQAQTMPAREATPATETPVRSQVQNAAPSTPTAVATATKPTTSPKRVDSVNYEALSKAATVDDVIDAVGDSEAFRRAYLAAQIERMRGTVDVDGRTMTADEYMAEQYHSLPDDENTIRAAIQQTEAAIADELKQTVISGEDATAFDPSAHPNILKLNIQLFAQKAKLDYVLDKGEEGSKTRRFYEQRLKGKDANHNQELVDMLKGRSETYNPIANEKTLEKANARLRDAKYADKLRRRVLRYNPRDLFSDVDMAAVQVMINDAINNGELGEAADMIQGLSRKGTELGRAVQIMSMQARLTPEGTLRAMQRTLQKAADKVIGDGASDSIDQIVDEIIDVMEQRVRQTSQPTEDGAEGDGDGSHIPVDISGATREQLRDALVEDLAATPGNYLSKQEIAKLVDKVIDDSTNIPEQVRRYIKKHIGTGTLAERIYEMQQKGHLSDAKLRRAMEESLGLPTLTESDIETVIDLATQMYSLDDDPVQQAEVMDELYDMLGRKLPKTAWETMTSWRKFGMLFNVKTHLRNIFSNAAYWGVRKVDVATAMMIERLFVRDKSKWGARLGWRKTEHGQSILSALEKSADLAVLQMQKRGKYEYGNSPLDNRKNLFGTSKLADTKFGKAADKASRWNSNMLELEDVKFFRPAYIDALGQIMTARGMTEITAEVEAMAYQRAAEATFRADNAISDAVSNIKRGNGTKGSKAFGAAVDVVMPFNKTPANIAVQSAMHSPIGLVKGAFDIIRATKNKDVNGVATAINTMAKGMTGTALLVAGLLLGGAGYFNTGYGKTEKERAADELAGIQENSFVVGGKSISVDWLQPAAAPLIVGASIAERFHEEGLSLGTVFGSVMDGTDALFDLSMMQSVYDIFGGYDTGVTATLGSTAENLISQSIPTVVGQVARAIDPVQRKTTGDSDFETVVNKVIAKVPGLTYLLDPELDVWGEEVHRTGKATEWSWALNVLQQFVSPSNIKLGTGTDAVSREIQRLYGELGSSAIPTAISRDEARDGDLDYVEGNRLLGAVNQRAVEDFINNKWPYTVQVELPNGKRRNVTKFYEDMTDEERMRVLKRIYKKAKEQVTEPNEADDAYFADIMRRLQ